MSDFGRKIADKRIKKVDRQLRAEFRQAEKELNEKLADFVAKHQAAGQKKWQQLVNGEITQAEYHSWMRGQVFQQKQWEAKVRQCQEILHEHNVQAAKIVHENKLDVFAECYDHAAYESELETGISFNLMNKEAVARLTKDRPQLLPEWKIDQPKDYKWNARKVNNAITQGIIQGESVDKIAKRLTKQLCTANEKKMRMFARTAMAGAMCGGEQKQMEDVATRLKIDILKEWLATLDSRTRDVHRQLDGQQVPYDEPFQSDLGAIMFPGDPKAELGNICNCRCDMVKRYPKFMRTNDWRQQETIDGMSYEEWKNGKKAKLAEAELSSEETYEHVWGEITGGTSWREFKEGLTDEQKTAIQRVIDKNKGRYSEELYWQSLTDGVKIDEELNRMLLDMESGKFEAEKHQLFGISKKNGIEERYDSPKANAWRGSKYEPNHVAVEKAMTVEEVTAELGKSGVYSSATKISLKNTDVRNAKEIAHESMAMTEKYPWMKRKISCVKDGKLKQNTNAEFVEDTKVSYKGKKVTRTVTFNKDKYKDRQEANIVTVAGMYHPIGTGTVKSTFDHEFAHGMVYAIAEKAGKDPDIVAQEIADKAFAKLGIQKTVDTVTYGLSGYGAESNHELISEAFAEYENSSTPRDIARTVVGELLSYAKGVGFK